MKNTELSTMRSSVVAGATHAYLAAMIDWCNGYFQSSVGKTEDGKAVVTQAIFPYGDYVVVDEIRVNLPSHNASGTTSITYRQKSVWWMVRYYLLYDEALVPFLKSAVKAACEKNDFVGGRGPLRFQLSDRPLVYRNNWEGSFCGFTGCEQVLTYGRNDEEVELSHLRYIGEIFEI